MSDPVKLEYLWLDGYKPTQSLRSKTKVLFKKFGGTLEECPMWSFDGSSTQQAEGGASDCLLKPAFICKDPQRKNAYLVMTEVLNADGTPHESNGRATINDDDNDFWFGFEQEYAVIDLDTNLPVGFPANGFPAPQGQYYCSVGARNAIARDFIEEHLDACLDAGLKVEGINAEVMCGQWEFQGFAESATQAGDEMWVARYLLERIGEKYGYAIDYHCKPVKGDWNGSGMHANFSNSVLRTCGDKDTYAKICEAFGTKEAIARHIAVYGADNHMRLTGLHETQSIDKFSWGVSDRGASIRVPIAAVESGYKGWLEDRRPNSSGDPYKIAAEIITTVKGACAKL